MIEMFDFFRDIILESRGIDSKKAEIERLEKKKEKDKDKIIFSSGLRVTIYVVGIMFAITTIVTLPTLLVVKSYLLFARAIIQILLDFAIMVLVKIHTKKSEIIALGLIAIFFVLQYSTMVTNLIGI